MQTTLIRHAAPEAIRAIPIPGAPSTQNSLVSSLGAATAFSSP